MDTARPVVPVVSPDVPYYRQVNIVLALVISVAVAVGVCVEFPKRKK